MKQPPSHPASLAAVAPDCAHGHHGMQQPHACFSPSVSLALHQELGTKWQRKQASHRHVSRPSCTMQLPPPPAAACQFIRGVRTRGRRSRRARDGVCEKVDVLQVDVLQVAPVCWRLRHLQKGSVVDVMYNVEMRNGARGIGPGGSLYAL
jgi:hypothetical protein